MSPIVRTLIEKGVRIPCPESVHVDADVDTDRIAQEGVVLHAGTRLFGEKTLICPGAEIGREGPVTLENCQVGPEVRLRGGYFKEAVFLDGASAGSGAHVREGTVLEEGSSIAHTVGLKQTILFPYVTLGSLINFCDCLLAGGTGPDNHSEVGSSYIHFNFTPNQDKATASLLGDVPRGVMLDQPPIFLGGQGGLVGPCRIAFGTVIAAGTIQRKDVPDPGFLVFGGGAGKEGRVPFRPGTYTGIERIARNNVVYTANLWALRLWVRRVRGLFPQDDFRAALHQGHLEKLDMGIRERVKRLRQLARKSRHQPLQERIPLIEGLFRTDNGEDPAQAEAAEAFLEPARKSVGKGSGRYLDWVRSLRPEEKNAGSRWLQGVVDGITERILSGSDT